MLMKGMGKIRPPFHCNTQKRTLDERDDVVQQLPGMLELPCALLPRRCLLQQGTAIARAAAFDTSGPRRPVAHRLFGLRTLLRVKVAFIGVEVILAVVAAAAAVVVVVVFESCPSRFLKKAVLLLPLLLLLFQFLRPLVTPRFALLAHDAGVCARRA